MSNLALQTLANDAAVAIDGVTVLYLQAKGKSNRGHIEMDITN
jgi:hypothetical protein